MAGPFILNIGLAMAPRSCENEYEFWRFTWMCFKGNINLAMAYAYQHIEKGMRVQSTFVSQYNSFWKRIHHTAHSFIHNNVRLKSFQTHKKHKNSTANYLPIIILTTSFIFAPFPIFPKKKDFFPRTSKAGTTWSYRSYKDSTKKN